MAVIMHAESVESRNRDAAALLDYGFAGWRLCRTAEGVELPELAVEQMCIRDSSGPARRSPSRP